MVRNWLECIPCQAIPLFVSSVQPTRMVPFCMVSCIWGWFLVLTQCRILSLGLVACLVALWGISLEIHILLEPCLAQKRPPYSISVAGVFFFPWRIPLFSSRD